MNRGGLFITQGTLSLEALENKLTELQTTAEQLNPDHSDVKLWIEVHQGALRLVMLWIASYVALLCELARSGGTIYLAPLTFQ